MDEVKIGSQLRHLRDDFKLAFTQTSIKAGMKANGGSSADLWKVPPDRLRIIDNFNPRMNTEKYRVGLQDLSNGMQKEGYKFQFPITGVVSLEDGEPVVWVVEGHRRTLAVQMAVAAGADIPCVSVVALEAKTPKLKLLANLVTSNTASHFTLLEKAIVAERMQAEGASAELIAEEFGCTTQAAEDMLVLMKAPAEVIALVAEETMSASLVIQTMRAEGDAAAEILLGSAAAAAQQGKTKVTARDLTGGQKAYRRAIQKAAPRLVRAVEAISADPAYASLSDQTRELIEALHKELAEERQRMEAAPAANDASAGNPPATPEGAASSKQLHVEEQAA